MPETSSKDLAIIASLELSHALQNSAPAAPFSHIGTAQLQALRQQTDIFSAALPSVTAQHAPRWHKTPHNLGALFNRGVPRTLGCQGNLSQTPL
jgi:hypothetical protein